MSKVVNKDHRPFCNNPQRKEQAIRDLSCNTVTNVALKNNVNKSTISRLKKENQDRIDALSQRIAQKHLSKFKKSIDNEINNYYELTKKDIDNITSVHIALKSQISKSLINPLYEKMGILPSRQNINMNINRSIDVAPILLAAEERMKSIGVGTAIDVHSKQLAEGENPDTDAM
tara:strand:+ start:109 stop:630 length:522 start_codon:yes stop_codon:yes gene_type:complete